MFACLECHPSSARSKRKVPPPQLLRSEVPGGAPFFRLTTTTHRGEIDWPAVEHAAGRMRTKMLFPQGVEPPIAEPALGLRAQLDPGLRSFAARRLPLLLCLRMAQQVLRGCHRPARELSVTFIDPRGQLCRQLEPFVQLAGSLRVCTPEPAHYRQTAAQLLSRYGVVLVVSNSPACFAQSDVVVAEDLSLFTGRERGLIFTPDTTPLPDCRVLRCGEPVLPPVYETLRPQGIDSMQFAAALFELCGVKEMERLPFARYGFDGVGQDYTLKDLAALLDEYSAVLRV
ncbi:MAG: hypothetical protein FWE40_08785 [Oscillospiraceae bacterium]|jgi:hypothetical protein|nr:hypothetical protein [Oscillospiraceae bacterium]